MFRWRYKSALRDLTEVTDRLMPVGGLVGPVQFAYVDAGGGRDHEHNKAVRCSILFMWRVMLTNSQEEDFIAVLVKYLFEHGMLHVT